MRIDPNIVPEILSDLQTSQVSLNTALQQVSTGKSVSVPSDNPAAAAAMVQNTIETGDVDQYTQNVSTLQTTVQSASSALSSVVTSLTQAVSLGTEGANGTNSSADLQALAQQVQGILTSVVSLANTSVGGHIYSAEPAQPLLTRRIRLRLPATPTTATTTRTPCKWATRPASR